MALPNGPMEIVFSFDTTGSMSGCLAEVRGRISDMVQRLQADIPGIKMALFAHGDYCDRHNYITKYIDFTDNVAELVDFAQNVSGTGGGDSDECYELVMYEVRTKLSWTPGSQRAFVLIGDCNPHEPNYKDNKLKLDWRREADQLAEMAVRIYSVQCHDYNSDKFYKDIAKRTHGKYLKLSDFKNVFDFLMSVCYKEKGEDMFFNYEKEVRARSSAISKDLHNLFGDLRDKGPGSSTSDETMSVAAPKKAARGIKTTKTIKHKKASLKDPIKVIKKSPSAIKKRTHSKKKRVPVCKKFLEKNLPKLRRENVPETNFLLRDMRWSKWQLAITPTPGSGYNVMDINVGSHKIPVLYEIAIQTKTRGKKYVVYNKISRGLKSGAYWQRKLLGRKDIKAQIDNVVRRKCNVYVRQMVVKGNSSKDQVKRALNRYDYPWNGLRSIRKGPRIVSKGQINISVKMEG